MAASNYIPAGRTSLVRRGDLKLQLQTEYASRPAPRITTTISRDGRVLHKIERELIKKIDSVEEQHHIERVIRRQHDDISEIIRNPEFDIKLGKDPDPEKARQNVEAEQRAAVAKQEAETVAEAEAEVEAEAEAESDQLTEADFLAPTPYPTAKKPDPPVRPAPSGRQVPDEELATPEDLERAIAAEREETAAVVDDSDWDETDQAIYAYERLLVAKGVTHVYRLDNQGKFIGHKEDKHFRKKFGFIFKNLHEMMNLFTQLPGHNAERERGVCEIQLDRLYFASVGTECYFVVVERTDGDTDFEKVIRKAVFGDADDGRELLRQ